MADDTVLQRVEFCTDPERSGLFHHAWLGEELVELASADGTSLQVPRGFVASFDTYFGSFPEQTWFAHTSVETVELRVRCRGTGRLVVRRETPQFDRYEIHATAFGTTAFGGAASNDEEFAHCVELRRDDPFRAEAGRVWFEIEADTDVEILEASWSSPDPGTAVAANVVFCTFNRLPYLRRILAAIVAHPSLAETVARVTVVNQGDPFDLSSFPEVAGSVLESRLHLVHQDNLGGCGGFSRGMWETLRSPELTHVVLLDDDIELHAESLARAIAFLGRTDGSVALGGHMLDLFHPTHLYEAGAQLDASTLLPRPILHDLDLADPEEIGDLLGRSNPDYNGWWFFALAADHIRRVGLPLPCFIRGDDIEYGIRLHQAGIRTITMAGVGVWHEPFYAKLGGWQQFFENRNLLAMASLRQVGDWRGLRRHLLRSFFGNIERSRYHSASFTVMAMEDFLSGADACVQTSDDALQRCLAVTREIGPRMVDRADATTEPVNRSAAASAARGGGLVSTAATVLRAPRRAALLATRLRQPPNTEADAPERPANAPVWSLAALDRYGVVVADGQVAEFERNPELERALWQRFMRAWVRIRPNEELRSLEARGERPWQPYWDDLFAEQDRRHG